MRAILGCGLAAMLMVSAGLSADDKKDEKIDAKKLLGKWEPADNKKDTKLVIEFAKDGKMTISADANGKDIKIDGTYKLDGKKLSIALSFGGQEQKETLTILKLTDDELSTEDSKGKKESMKRIKDKK
jgi:uncharacterized protein (TIGR03066 family)